MAPEAIVVKRIPIASNITTAFLRIKLIITDLHFAASRCVNDTCVFPLQHNIRCLHTLCIYNLCARDHRSSQGELPVTQKCTANSDLVNLVGVITMKIAAF
jgi:hypothetical protein